MDEHKTGTINIGVVYHDRESGEEGVVLLVDRQVSLGSLGRELPYSFKLSPIAPNISVTMSGSVADAQEVVRKLQSAVIDGTEMYREVAEQVGQEPILTSDDVQDIRNALQSEDVASGEAMKYELLKKRLELPTTSKKAAKKIRDELNGREVENGGKVSQRARQLLEEQRKLADDFFEPDEFTLDILEDHQRNDEKYVRRIRPVRRESWSGTKVFPNASVVFQRVDDAVYPTVDGLANLFAHTYQERLKEAGYEGLVGGVNPIDGAKLYELEGAGGFLEARTWAAMGSGSMHITALMESEVQKRMKKKGYLTREDALALTLKGAIPVATGMDNYVAPPLDVVIIKKDRKSGEMASYKVKIDLSVDKKCVVMPDCLTMDALAKKEGEDVYYKAKVAGGKNGVTIHQMPGAGHFGKPTRIENRKLESDIKNVAGSYLKVMKSYASK